MIQPGDVIFLFGEKLQVGEPVETESVVNEGVKKIKTFSIVQDPEKLALQFEWLKNKKEPKTYIVYKDDGPALMVELTELHKL